MSCGITGGISLICDSLRRIGGVRKTAYIANLDDISSYTTDASGYITNIVFNSYKGFHKFEGRKQSHSGGYTVVVQEGGNKFYQQDVTLKEFCENPTDDAVMEELLVSNVVAVLESNNGQFFLYGKENGLEQTAGTQNTGTSDSSDISDQVTLTGGEINKPKRVFTTDETTTKALLESLVV